MMMASIIALIASATLMAQDKPETCTPASYEEALDCLDALLSDEAKAQLDTMAYDELGLTHFGLGLWMRTSWIRGDRAPVAAEMRAMGFRHADDMSGTIIEGYWARRHGCTIDMDATIAYYASYWEAQDQWIEGEPDPETGIIPMQAPEGGFTGMLEEPKPDCPFSLEETPPERGQAPQPR